MNTHKSIKGYQVRYAKVIKDLERISKMQPEEKYMVRLMDTVIFQDFETALEAVFEDFENANDNGNKNFAMKD